MRKHRRKNKVKNVAAQGPSLGDARPASHRVSLGAMAAGFGLMLGSGSAFAQAAPAPASAASEPTATQTLPAVRVRGRAEEQAKENLQTNKTTVGKGQQDIRDVPQSLTVVTEKLIDDVKLDTLRQALHYTAGITFAATENGTDQDIRMRGFPVATTGDLLIDGMKDPSQYDRDSFNYDRIEVLRGSASMIFGRGSTGGVINQVTKKPNRDDINEVVFTGGSSTYVRGTADFSIPLGRNAGLRVNAMGTNADNFGAKIDKYGIAPQFGWGLETPDEFNIGAFYLNVDNVPMSNLRYLNGSIASNIPAHNFYGTQSDYLRGEAAYLTGSWLHRFGGGGQVKTQFRSGLFTRSSWGTTVGYCGAALTATGTCPTGTPALTTVDDSTNLTRSGLSPRRDRIRGTYLQSDYSNTFVLAGQKHEVLGGVDFADEGADRFGAWGAVGTNYNKGGTSVGNPDDGRTLALAPVYRKTSDYAGRAYGAYVQDLWSVTPVWKVLGGVRYDRFAADMHQITYANAQTNVSNGTVSSKLSYPSLWSYRAGVLFQPTATQSYHVSYGTSFNTSADTYQYTTQQIADVPAEKSRNIEVGAKLDWLDGNLSTRLAIFRTEKYNERTTDSDFAGTYPVLSGKRHSQGVEVDVVGRLTSALEVYLSYSYIHKATIDKVGTAVTGPGGTSLVGAAVGLSPKHTGALWLSYQVAPQWRVAGGVRGSSENRPLQGGTGAASLTAKVPGYVAGDAMVEYLISKDAFTQLNVSNVTDRVYGDQLYPGFYTPGEGRMVKLSLGLRF